MPETSIATERPENIYLPADKVNLCFDEERGAGADFSHHLEGFVPVAVHHLEGRYNFDHRNGMFVIRRHSDGKEFAALFPDPVYKQVFSPFVGGTDGTVEFREGRIKTRHVEQEYWVTKTIWD